MEVGGALLLLEFVAQLEDALEVGGHHLAIGHRQRGRRCRFVCVERFGVDARRVVMVFALERVERRRATTTSTTTTTALIIIENIDAALAAVGEVRGGEHGGVIERVVDASVVVVVVVVVGGCVGGVGFVVVDGVLLRILADELVVEGRVVVGELHVVVVGVVVDAVDVQARVVLGLQVLAAEVAHRGLCGVVRMVMRHRLGVRPEVEGDQSGAEHDDCGEQGADESDGQLALILARRAGGHRRCN